MANDMWLIGGFVIVCIVVIWVLSAKQRHGGTIDTPYIRGESVILSKEHGLAYVLGVEHTKPGLYEYRLDTDHGVVREEYADYQLLDVNKHLNIVTRPIIITSGIIAELGKKIDVVKLTQSAKELQGENEALQSEIIKLKSNVENEVQKRMKDAAGLLQSMPRMQRPKQ